MAREIGKLSALAVSKAKGRGYLSDGGGLYLQIGRTGAKSWLFRYMRYKKQKWMGLGPLHTISLSEARVKAAACRTLLLEGIDPIQERKERKAKAKFEAAKEVTFEYCAKRYIEAKKAEWKNEKHIWQWTNCMEKYVYPVIGKKSVQEVDTEWVLKVLEPIWPEITETAARIRERMEAILDWAKTQGHRTGENPARWKGHLENSLAKPSKIRKVKHYAAMPYSEIGSFIAQLETAHPGNAAQALKLLILTATRTNEVIGAQWPEFDLDKAIWVIPAVRMKMGKEHRVPLSEPALTILAVMHRQHNTSPYAFPGQKDGSGPMSNMALLMLMRRMDLKTTVHGFRSSFRDWAAEQTNHPREVAEAALAHAIENKVEAAYFRSDLFEKRRLMMNEWATYCTNHKQVS